MLDVAVIGSLNLDLVATTARHPSPGETVLGTDFSEHPGGKGLNQAVAASRSGAAVAMLGIVGDDDAGRRLRSVAADEGIDVDALETSVSMPTGRAIIVVDHAGENSIVVVPGANATMTNVVLPSSTVLLAQLEIPIETVTSAFAGARGAGTTTVLNPGPAQALPDTLVANCDVIVPNEHELELVGGVESLLERGAGAVVTTRGGAGVTVTESDRSKWSVAAFPVEPIDTTGAGDAFCGALAARLAVGDDLRAAVEFAAAAGALATTRSGAVPSLPHLDRIESLRQTRSA
ncbi:MAG: ribokinase [Ilumatobacteraceae bacterium]